MIYKITAQVLSSAFVLCVILQTNAMATASSQHIVNQTIAITLKNNLQPQPSISPLMASPLVNNAQIISLHGKYTIPLTPGERAAMALLSSGIVWTDVPKVGNAVLQTQPVYFTPYISSDIPARSTSVDLWSNAQLLTNLPIGTDPQGNKYLPVTLYHTHDVAIFSQVQIQKNGQKLISYYVQQRQGQRVQLFHGMETSGQHEYLYEQGNSIILLVQRATLFGQINFGQEINLVTGEKNAIPKTPGMLSVMQNNGTTQIQAGMITYSFDQKGRMSQQDAPANPAILIALQKYLGKPINHSFLPSVLETSTVFLSYHKKHMTQLTIKVNKTPMTLSIFSLNSKTKEKNSTTFAHEFTLSSHEGPPINWQMNGTLTKQNWTASFVTKGWTYSIGPFSSPAEKAASTWLSQLVAYAAQTTPIPTVSEGTASITLVNQDSMQPASTVIRFPLTANTQATFQGPGYSPFQNITLWTFVTNP